MFSVSINNNKLNVCNTHFDDNVNTDLYAQLLMCFSVSGVSAGAGGDDKGLRKPPRSRSRLKTRNKKRAAGKENTHTHTTWSFKFIVLFFIL